MKRILYYLAVLMFAGSVWATEPTTYTRQSISTNDPIDSAAAEALFLSDLATDGFSVFSEDFEGAAWEGTRASSSLEHILSKGIDWQSSAGNRIVSARDVDGYVEPQPFLIWGLDPLTGWPPIPHTVLGESATKLYAIGFWADGTGTQGKIKVILDDTVEVTFKRIVGYTHEPPDPPEPIKENVRLDYTKEFFGVYAPDGFNKFQLLEYAGEFDEVILMWMRTFTFAYRNPAPSSDIQLSMVHSAPGQMHIEFTSTAAHSNFALQATSDLLDPYGWVTLTNTPTPVTQRVYRITTDQMTETQRMFRVISTP